MNAVATRAEIVAQSNRQHPASQATSIEQSRAVAEVQGAIVVAQNNPRDEAAALEKALASCRTKEVAEGAFFKFPRGGESVSGETIGLAVELARCWGNIKYGIMELNRDEIAGHTEMRAYAWDMQANTTSDQTFIVPHKRDTKSGAKALTDMRDIYENNANNGARRLRECIFRILPPFLKEAAKQACYATLSDGGEKPLPVALAEAVQAFATLGIGKERIEAKMGPVAKMTPIDLANLKVSYRSISRQEISGEDEFPRVGHVETARELAAKAAAPTQPEKADPPRQAADKGKAAPQSAGANADAKERPETAEGPAETQRGEAHTFDAAAFAKRIKTCGILLDWRAIEADWLAVKEEVSDEDRALIEPLIDGGRETFGSAGQ